MSVLSLFTPKRTELGVVEAAKLLERPKSTVSRWLSAMEAAGFLERDGETRRYRLGMRLAALGQLARQSTALQRVAQPVLRELAQATGETSDLVVRTGTEAVNLVAEESPRPIIRVGWLGRRIPLHATAAGKALLAWRPADELRELLVEPLERYTAATLVTLDELMAELERIREAGYSTSVGEFQEELVGLAAPVWDHTRTVVATVTIGAPAFRSGPEVLPVQAERVVSAAKRLSGMLGHPTGTGGAFAPTSP